jgi:hypothetical protein
MPVVHTEIDAGDRAHAVDIQRSASRHGHRIPYRIFDLIELRTRTRSRCLEKRITTKLEVEKGRELERRLAEVVKVLPFVPAGEFKKAKAQRGYATRN